MRKRRWLALSLGAVAVAACSDGGPPTPAGLRLVSPLGLAQTMVPLEAQPVVQVVDANGNPVALADQLVTTAVVGPGQITSGGSATTDASGVATFKGLTLGAVNGAVGPTKLEFTSPGLTPIQASTTLSCAVPLFEVGARVSDRLSAGDCRDTPGQYHKRYRLNVTDGIKAVRLISSDDFGGGLFVGGATSDRMLGLLGGGNKEFKVFVPTGSNIVKVTSGAGGTEGQFTFTAVSVPEDEAECEGAFFAMFVSPLHTSQTLRSECTNGAGWIIDYLDFVMSEREAVSVTVTSTAFVPRVILFGYPSHEVADTGVTTGNTATMTHANQTGESAIYYIAVTSADGKGTGAYTLQATVARAGGAVMASGDSVGPKAFAGPWDLTHLAPLQRLMRGGAGQVRVAPK